MAFITSSIYGKINCKSQYISVSNSIYFNQHAGDYYTSLYKFLVNLSSSGIVDLVTMNTGSGGNGVGYWDQATHFGNGAFSVWRFKPTGSRIWDWYLYIHTNSGSTAGSYQETAAQTPTNVLGNAAYDSTTYRSVVAQAAFCFSASLTGSDSFNPWNGTISNGAATKGTPVWVSGSNNNTLAVFPRQNNLSGSNTTNKDNCMPLLRAHIGQYDLGNTYHFWSDGHAIMSAWEMNYPTNISLGRFPQAHYFAYFGPFTLTNAVISTNAGKLLGGTGSYGFIAFRSNQVDPPNGLSSLYSQNLPANFQVVGQVTNSGVGNSDGGMFVNTNWGVRNFIFHIDTATWLVNGDPCSMHNWNWLETPIPVSINESGCFGTAGQIDTPLLRTVGGGIQPLYKSNKNQRIVFGARDDSSTQGQTSFLRSLITVPWPSGSYPIPPTSTQSTVSDRDGQDFTFINYTGVLS